MDDDTDEENDETDNDINQTYSQQNNKSNNSNSFTNSTILQALPDIQIKQETIEDADSSTNIPSSSSNGKMGKFLLYIF